MPALFFFFSFISFHFDMIDYWKLNSYVDFLLISENHFKMFLPEVFLTTSILVLILYASLIVTSRSLGYPLLTTSLSRLCILVLSLTFVLIVNSPIIEMIVYQNTFIFDELSLSVKEILTIATVFCLLMGEDVLKNHQINNIEYLILILCAVLGLLFLVSSFDLISLYLAIEMQSLCLYVLAASKKDSSFSTEAGIKYFILGSFSSGLLLFGISLLYGCCGTTNFENFNLLFSGVDYKMLGLANFVEKSLFFIIIAFLFKIAAVPCHLWSPDVYEGAPTNSTIFFAVIPKIALFSIFLRFFQGIFSSFEEITLCVFVISSIASVIVGSFVTLNQKKLKRLLAFSSVSHVGYLLLGFAANSIEGTQSLFFYLIVYMLTSLCLWSVVLSTNTCFNKKQSKTLVDLAFVSSINPLLGLSGMLAFFSLAGIPPLVGFFAKMEIFVSALGSSLFFASIIAVLSSVISSYYYIRLVKTIYFEKVTTHFFVLPIVSSCSFIMSLSTFFLLFLFMDPSLLLLFTQKMALCLFN